MVSRKEYWLACIINVLAMCVFLIPYALFIIYLSLSVEIAIIIFLIIFLTPAFALYFRRANDANWSVLTALFMALMVPMGSGLIVGVFPSVPKGTSWSRFYSTISKIFVLSYGLCFYGGFGGIIFFNDPTSIPILSYSGFFLGTSTLIFFVIKMRFSK